MSTFFLTLSIAFIIILIALAGLGLSLMIRGRASIQRGSCGRDPNKKREGKDCSDKRGCSLCDDESKKDE